MTPNQLTSRKMWLGGTLGLLLTAVISWYLWNLGHEYVHQAVGAQTAQDKGHNAYETLALRECEKQAQADAQKGIPNVKTCSYAEPNAKSGTLGAALLWGAIAITILSTMIQGFRWLRRFVRGR